MVITH